MTYCPPMTSKYLLPMKGDNATRVNLTEKEILLVSGYCLSDTLEVGFMQEEISPNGEVKSQPVIIGGSPKCISSSNVTEIIIGPGTFYAYVKAGDLEEAFLCGDKVEPTDALSMMSGASGGDSNIEINAECIPLGNTGILTAFDQLK